MDYAILLAGHGSRDKEGVAEFLGLGRLLRARVVAWSGDPATTPVAVETAFLELARPTIQEGIDRLAEDGARKIVVLPGLLMAAGHAKNDMARELRLAQERHSQVELVLGRSLEGHPFLAELCHLRYQEALAGLQAVPAEETLLLLVARGSHDPEANAHVASLTRSLGEMYSVGRAKWAFAGITSPLLPAALTECEQTGLRRIVVQPYLLSTGVLLNRIHEEVRRCQTTNGEQEYIVTAHLQAHSLVVAALCDRVKEAIGASRRE